ncbi:5-formyltetrahydrofolate cyclo-ligase [Halobacillus rhizosphaerae]|uniref:5-formyltetrahydrofolate cyclo-ligase n=1 Tax=Halobacillus rhizosphaerae TaxID=3064889 RepID=UPI00398B9A90
MEKKEWRKKAKDILTNLGEERLEISKLILNRLFSSKIWKASSVIGVTISKGDEWPTLPIIQKAWDQGKTVVVPKCVPNKKELIFYKITDLSQLEVVYYGLKEPDPSKTVLVQKQAIELLLVPGLLFNEDGYRIGFGGGYYDRYLEKYVGETISLASEKQLQEQIPIESFDIPVQFICTEERMITCR